MPGAATETGHFVTADLTKNNGAMVPAPALATAGDDRATVREMVDPPALPRTLVDAIERRRAARRHPVIPETVATRDAARALMLDMAGHVWFLMRFQALRAPGYALQLV